MLNSVVIMGRLTNAPELKTTEGGLSVTSFSVANQRNYKNAQGEKDTDFYDIVAWRTTAEFICRNFKKGSMIAIKGHLQTRKYTDKNGNNRTSLEIVAEEVFFGDSGNRNTGETSTNVGNEGFAEVEGDGDLPFDGSFPTL